MSFRLRRGSVHAASASGRRAIALLLCGGLALTGCARNGSPPAETVGAGASASPVVARVAGREITQHELDERIRSDLFEQEYGGRRASRLYGAREETIESMVDELLLERAADDAGLTPDAWRAETTAALPPISDEAVAAFFEDNRDQLSASDTLEKLAPNIRRFLEIQREDAAIEALREQYPVEIELLRPRHEVAAIGPSLGPADAPVTIVEFSDYQCPYCARAEPVIKELLRRHPEQIRLVYRHLPLDFHKQARSAARAAICAEAQGRFWDYHDMLFANQHALGDEQLRGYALELGLDEPAWTACLADPATDARVERDMADAAALDATGTPAFFINGIHLTGAQPIEQFERLIAPELARGEDAGN